MNYSKILLIVFALVFVGKISAQPMPGDLFRDYVWTTPTNSQKFLRVIADGDYRTPVGFKNELPDSCFTDGWIILDKYVDLEKAIKAEIQIELLLSHDETTGLAVMVNQNTWHEFTMPEAVPEPKSCYLQHNYPIVQVPLSEILEGRENKLRFRVDSVQRWNMPQNIIYGIRLRVYYEKTKPHATAKLKISSDDNTIGENQQLELSNVKGNISEVNYLGLFTDVNLEGDGISRQWHYTYYRGEMRNHIGKSTKSPFSVNWDTSWIPDQPQQIELSALVTDNNGMTYFLPASEGFRLKRNYSVELCLPYEIPKRWATREGEFTEKINILGNPDNAESFQLVFVSWSPDYLNGIFINDWLMPTFEDCDYCYGIHRLTQSKIHFLNQGENIIKTGKTPLKRGKMVHGAEIQFPGMMLLVKYQKPAVKISEDVYNNTPHFKVETHTATYYIEKQSGGCSSMVDEEGHDWIKFRKTGNNGPTLSSDSDYRGVPNLVWQDPGDGIGHPGFAKCSTKMISDNELLVMSNDKKWQFRWVFHANYAEVVIEKTDDSRNYWFLYEGPVAGKFSPESHYWGNNQDGIRTDKPALFTNPVSGNWNWVFFGDRAVEKTLFVVKQQSDSFPDFFGYMGNSKSLGNMSPDGMNVFGFGREVKTAPCLKGQNRFFIGLFPEKIFSAEAFKNLAFYINQINFKDFSK